MNIFFRTLSIIVLTCLMLSCQDEAKVDTITQEESQEQMRIISLSGSVTELLYDFGLGDSIVGVDITSIYPPQANEKTKLGHVSNLNTEGVLSLDPTLIIVDKSEVESPAIKQLEDAGLNIFRVEQGGTLDNAVLLARQLQDVLPVSDQQIAEIEKQYRQDKEKLDAETSSMEKHPKVLFLYARGAGRLLVAGTETEADKMIEAAGGQNAISTFENFEALTPEALLSTNPDVILMFSSGLESLDGKEGLAAIPGMQATEAFKNDRIIAMDGHYLLGFGPRAPKAAIDLARELKK